MVRIGKVPLLLVLCLLAACRSATVLSPPIQQQQKHTDSAAYTPLALPSQRAFCTYCSMQGSIELRSPELTAEGTFRLLLAGRDSLQGIIYGPLGLVAARAYCTPDETMIFEALSQRAYQVQLPLAVESLFPFPIHREEVFALLRCELPFDTARYVPFGRTSNDSSMLFICRDTAFIDLARVNIRGELVAYQRKLPDNRLLLAIEYGDYQNWGDQRYPARIRIVAPVRNLELILTPDTIAEQHQTVPFRFRLPSNIPRTVLK